MKYEVVRAVCTYVWYGWGRRRERGAEGGGVGSGHFQAGATSLVVRVVQYSPCFVMVVVFLWQLVNTLDECISPLSSPLSNTPPQDVETKPPF